MCGAVQRTEYGALHGASDPLLPPALPETQGVDSDRQRPITRPRQPLPGDLGHRGAHRFLRPAGQGQRQSEAQRQVWCAARQRVDRRHDPGGGVPGGVVCVQEPVAGGDGPQGEQPGELGGSQKVQDCFAMGGRLVLAPALPGSENCGVSFS